MVMRDCAGHWGRRDLLNQPTSAHGLPRVFLLQKSTGRFVIQFGIKVAQFAQFNDGRIRMNPGVWMQYTNILPILKDRYTHVIFNQFNYSIFSGARLWEIVGTRVGVNVVCSRQYCYAWKLAHYYGLSKIIWTSRNPIAC